MDFLKKGQEMLSGNNANAGANTNTNTNNNAGQQQQGGAVNNSNEDYGDKGAPCPSLLSP
jgi:hypothetical protein